MAKTLAQESRRFGGVVNNEALGRYVERIERLHEDRKSLNDDIREVYGEAKETGLVPAILRQIVRERQLDDEVRHDQYALLDAYRRALGMLADTPLGEAAINRAQHAGGNGSARTRRAAPKPFADQAVHTPRRRGRPRKIADLMAAARAHLGGDTELEDEDLPLGTA